MAWSFEAKAGVGWALLILILMLGAIWAEVQANSLLPLLLPILAYIGFAAWVVRVKK